MRYRNYYVFILLIFIILGFPILLFAQIDYPTKPIQMYIGFPPGGSTDIVGRALANEAKNI